jgi:hypothetical protein
LRVEHVDEVRRRLLVVDNAVQLGVDHAVGDPKGDEWRDVPVPKFVMAELKKQIQGGARPIWCSVPTVSTISLGRSPTGAGSPGAPCAASVCPEPCTVCAGPRCIDAEFCESFPCTLCARSLAGATGVTSPVAPCNEGCAHRRVIEACVLANVATVRVRRAGLPPSATSIRVLTATAVSMIAGNTHAVPEL